MCNGRNSKSCLIKNTQRELIVFYEQVIDRDTAAESCHGAGIPELVVTGSAYLNAISFPSYILVENA